MRLMRGIMGTGYFSGQGLGATHNGVVRGTEIRIVRRTAYCAGWVAGGSDPALSLPSRISWALRSRSVLARWSGERGSHWRRWGPLGQDQPISVHEQLRADLEVFREPSQVVHREGSFSLKNFRAHAWMNAQQTGKI